MNYREFDDDGPEAAVYFILDQSRDIPPYERAELMLKACAIFPHDSKPRGALRHLACELFDCDQIAQRIIATLRNDNARLLGENTAFEFLLTRLARCSLDVKMELTGNALNIGFAEKDRMASYHAWIDAHQRILLFQQRLELFMFRLRTHHWRISNAEAEEKEEIFQRERRAAQIAV